MGNCMNKVLPGLYVGSYRDSKDLNQLDQFQITHIVAIHDTPKQLFLDRHYLCINASDKPHQNLLQYFSLCNDFMHAARLRNGNVLIHCLIGMSRSVTVAVAYIMTISDLSWKDALKVIQSSRSIANPNIGFQKQLQDFENYFVHEERKRLRERYPSLALKQIDLVYCANMLKLHNEKFAKQNPAGAAAVIYQPPANQCKGQCHLFRQQCPNGFCYNQSVSRRTSALTIASHPGPLAPQPPLKKSICTQCSRSYSQSSPPSLANSRHSSTENLPLINFTKFASPLAASSSSSSLPTSPKRLNHATNHRAQYYSRLR